jgi:hypothetical protein
MMTEEQKANKKQVELDDMWGDGAKVDDSRLDRSNNKMIGLELQQNIPVY